MLSLSLPGVHNVWPPPGQDGGSTSRGQGQTTWLTPLGPLSASCQICRMMAHQSETEIQIQNVQT